MTEVKEVEVTDVEQDTDIYLLIEKYKYNWSDVEQISVMTRYKAWVDSYNPKDNSMKEVIDFKFIKIKNPFI